MLSEKKQDTKLYAEHGSNLIIEITYMHILKLYQVFIFVSSENKIQKEKYQNLITMIFCRILILFFMFSLYFLQSEWLLLQAEKNNND